MAMCHSLTLITKVLVLSPPVFSWPYEKNLQLEGCKGRRTGDTHIDERSPRRRTRNTVHRARATVLVWGTGSVARATTVEVGRHLYRT
ncbi:hypothetical protein H6P81_011058 [Aristolochia fimbriata]|uniref:Secreted protein n=1 Tax=Aristolochia fimbriata TaxID=158543 RepID=A0AAV7EQT4_ARIFI|nr:hypothetical protein H6P81_011058 [Aristolochia fimbriata]